MPATNTSTKYEAFMLESLVSAQTLESEKIEERLRCESLVSPQVLADEAEEARLRALYK